MNQEDINNTCDCGNKPAQLNIKIFGVGNAGCRVISRIPRVELNNVQTIGINTESPSLEQCDADERVLIGANVACGMGTGGDPDRGRNAASESAQKIRALCEGSDIILIVAGLGCGTGTGATPAIASYSKEAGALVLCVVTLPFDFEGGRCMRQAFMGLRYLNQVANGVICVPNQSFSKLVPNGATFYENLNLINNYLAEGICSLIRLLTYPGEMSTTFGDLCSMLREKHARSAIATVTAKGENRAQQICDKLSAHPMLEQGNNFSEAESVLVNFSTVGDITTDEVRIIMDFIKRSAKKAFFKVGDSVDSRLCGELKVTVLTAAPAENLYNQQQQIQSAKQSSQEYPEVYSFQNVEPSSKSIGSSIPAPPPLMSNEQISSIYTQNNPANAIKMPIMRQAQFDFEVVSHGRFENTYPTIHKGQNLDVPTYSRRCIKLN